MLVASLTIHFALFVVLDPAVALGHIGCRYFRQTVFGLARRPQLLVVCLDRLKCVNLLLNRRQSRCFSLSIADVNDDWFLHVEPLASLRITHLIGQIQGLVVFEVCT